MLAFALTITIGWWIIPAIITLIGFIAAIWAIGEDKGGYMAGLGSMLIIGVFIFPIVSVSWIIYLAAIALSK